MDTVLVISIFYLMQYHSGYYGTDMLVRPQPTLINSLQELRNSDKIPVFIEADPVMSYLNVSGETEQAILKKLPLDGNGESEYIVSKAEITASTVASLIRTKKGAAVMNHMFRESVEYFYCHQLLEGENRQPTLHTSYAKLYANLFLNVVNLNISHQLEARLHRGLRRTFESNILITTIVDFFLDITLGVCDLSKTNNIKECLSHKFAAGKAELRPLRPVNLIMVFYGVTSAMLVSLLVLIGESTFRGIKVTGFYQYDETTKKVSGVTGLFFHDLFVKNNINASYRVISPANLQGSCDKHRLCTGNLDIMNTPNWDYSLFQLSTIGLEYEDYLPFKFDSEAFELDYKVMSSFELKESEDANVLRSFEHISLYVVGLYIVWFIVACLINSMLKEILRKVLADKAMYHDSYLWHVMRILCSQWHSRYELQVFRIMDLVLVVSMFYLLQYYYGNYGTEVLVRPKPTVINTLKQLKDSDKVPVFLEADPIISLLNTSGDATEQAILGKLKFDSYGSSEYIVSKGAENGIPMNHIANLIRDNSGAAIMSDTIRDAIEFFYCQRFVDQSEDKHLEPTLHTGSEKYYANLFLQPFNVNISRKLEGRLHSALRRIFETHVFITFIIDGFLNVVLTTLSISPTSEITQCLLYKSDSSNDEIQALRLVNLKYVMYIGMSAILVALLVMLSEHVAQAGKRKAKRGRKKTVWVSKYQTTGASVFYRRDGHRLFLSRLYL
ncbi:hypothetical protein HDE_02034 [Halotydeus destructor]|nr:hypothetical protein HDE_02034 [Halotydeus destructor]